MACLMCASKSCCVVLEKERVLACSLGAGSGRLSWPSRVGLLSRVLRVELTSLD